MAPTPPRISDDQIRRATSPYGISLQDDQLSMVRQYIQLLLKWNQSISLTTVTDTDEILSRHFGESMFAAQVRPVENCRLADVGTGPGFPGLPLKILVPSLKLTLIESNKKKCAFLREVVSALGLKEVEVLAERFEQLRAETLPVDLISARALGEFKELLHWSEKAIASGGNLLLWLGAEDVTRMATVRNWLWEPAIKIPDSQRRFLLIGRPQRADGSKDIHG
jgi:16S rRNA (guanine527-N7)-methyltransferase